MTLKLYYLLPQLSTLASHTCTTQAVLPTIEARCQPNLFIRHTKDEITLAKSDPKQWATVRWDSQVQLQMGIPQLEAKLTFVLVELLQFLHERFRLGV